MALIKKQNSGFTLIEILVAMVIFSLIVGAVMGVFVSGIKSQRRILATQELLDQTSYALEYMSRALRMAGKDLSGSCLVTAGANNNYETNEVNRDRIRFLNYQNKCQEFFLEGNQLKERKSSDGTAANFGTALLLTSVSLRVNSFKVGPSDSWDQNDNLQPAVTIYLNITGKEQSNIKTQTTISQRNLDVQY